MPIYEWQCLQGHRFEVLSAMKSVGRARRCPQCSARSSRVISAVAIHGGAQIATASERAANRDIDVTSLKIPTFARPCGMDDYSATRLAAHKVGRGAEFDDKMAKRKERETSRGEPVAKAPRKPKHTH